MHHNTESRNRGSTWALEKHRKELKERFLHLSHRSSHVGDDTHISEFKQMKELKIKKTERQDEGNAEESNSTTILFSGRKQRKQMSQLPAQGTTIWQQKTAKTSVLSFWGYAKRSSNSFSIVLWSQIKSLPGFVLSLGLLICSSRTDGS